MFTLIFLYAAAHVGAVAAQPALINAIAVVAVTEQAMVGSSEEEPRQTIIIR